MRQLYNALLLILLPFILVRLFLKSLKISAYRKRIAERFGFVTTQHKESIWVHAVSFGELMAAIPLIRQLQKQFPDNNIVVTTMTITGSQLAQKIFNQDIFHCYCPYDYPFAIKRFLKNIRPTLLILMETEIWPNWLFYCGKQRIPIMLANAKLSENSFKGYQRFSFFLKPLLSAITFIAAQSKQDAERFKRLGIAEEKIKIFGNLKFDLSLPTALFEQAKHWRTQSQCQNRSIFIAASTHDGEEKVILDAFQLLKKQLPDLLLMIAPRHPERFEEVAKLCSHYSNHVVHRRHHEFATQETDIFIVDTMGELLLFYAISNVAFVGGSLVNIGGHNLLEAAACGIPTITGKYMQNQFIHQQMQQLQTTFTVNDQFELTKIVAELLQNETLRANIRDKNITFIEHNRGVLQKHLQVIKDLS